MLTRKEEKELATFFLSLSLPNWVKIINMIAIFTGEEEAKCAQVSPAPIESPIRANLAMAGGGFTPAAFRRSNPPRCRFRARHLNRPKAELQPTNYTTNFIVHRDITNCNCCKLSLGFVMLR